MRAQAKPFFSRHNTDGVRVAHSTTPSLNADDGVTFVDNAKLHGFGDTPQEAAIDVFLPDDRVEVGFGFGKEEGVDTAVEVRVLEWLVGKL